MSSSVARIREVRKLLLYVKVVIPFFGCSSGVQDHSKVLPACLLVVVEKETFPIDTTHFHLLLSSASKDPTTLSTAHSLWKSIKKSHIFGISKLILGSNRDFLNLWVISKFELLLWLLGQKPLFHQLFSGGIRVRTYFRVKLVKKQSELGLLPK